MIPLLLFAACALVVVAAVWTVFDPQRATAAAVIGVLCAVIDIDIRHARRQR